MFFMISTLPLNSSEIQLKLIFNKYHSNLLKDLVNFNEIFRKFITYHNLKSLKKPHPLSSKCIFWKNQRYR